MTATKRVSNIDHGGQTKTTGLPTPTDDTDAARKKYVDDGVAAAKQRVNHLGTQPASTISDFDQQVRTSRLDQMAAPTNPLVVNNQRVTNLADATADSDAPSFGQVKMLLSGLRKTDVKAIAVANVALTGTQTVDGVSLSAGDRVLLVGQTNAALNGIYVVSAGAWTRAVDADSASEFATGWLVTVTQGSVNADTLWGFDTDGVVTLGTTNLAFNKIGPLTSADRDGYATTCPTVASGNTWSVGHGLGTLFVQVQVRRTAAPMDFVDAAINVIDANTIGVSPDIPFASGEYTVLVKKVQ